MTIHEGDIFFHNVEDPIKTEETIFHQIKENRNLELDYVGVPLAYRLNKRGISDTQSFLDAINVKYPQRKFFVCQHIWVNLLNFGDNLVFTPHTTKSDLFYFIPHFNPTYSDKPDIIEIKNRQFDFSFMGSYETNQLRAELANINNSRSFFKNTELWFFSQQEEMKYNLGKEYREVLRTTKFALCPPGTGPSTLRLFEAMSLGCIPIIFNDLKLPIDLKNLVVRSTYEDFKNGNTKFILENLDLSKRSKQIYESYWKKYSNNNLSESILSILEKK